MAFRNEITLLLIGLWAIVGGIHASLGVHTVEGNLTIEQFALNTPTCSGTFVTHALPYMTEVDADDIHMFESNGTGLAINDLDADGDFDLVFANLDGDSSILWNDGDLTFSPQSLRRGAMRAVAIVDVEGDGWFDIVFTQPTTAPIYIQNPGEIRRDVYIFQPLPGVRKPAYTMAWGDLNMDDDLDLVTATYDAELGKLLGNAFLFGEGGGVYYYARQGRQFTPTRLSDEAQGLAILLADINGDGGLDITVGNDFGLPDQTWIYDGESWNLSAPFAAMTHSTMSFDIGDVDNDGHGEIFATDMKPYRDDPVTWAAWEPVIGSLLSRPLLAGDIQVMENVLQTRVDDGQYVNHAARFGLTATGWSWSGKFGDLNQDGYLDIYVVNGMIAQELFSHLPENALVEENQAFRNEVGERFVPAPQWNLNALTSGRGMSMADLDSDGDLDIVVNNLDAPAQLFENQLCSGKSLQVDLRHPGSGNLFAIGAALSLKTTTGTYYRDVRAVSGYLSGDPTRVHFGFPDESVLLSLEIVWPHGQQSNIDLKAISPDSRIILTQL